MWECTGTFAELVLPACINLKPLWQPFLSELQQLQQHVILQYSSSSWLFIQLLNQREFSKKVAPSHISNIKLIIKKKYFRNCLPSSELIYLRNSENSHFYIHNFFFYIKHYSKYKVRFDFCWVWKSLSNLNGFLELQKTYKTKLIFQYTHWNIA